MEKKTWIQCGTALLCTVILCASLMVCANYIGRAIYSIHFPSSISVSDGSSQDLSDQDFLSIYEAAAYLRVDDATLTQMVTDGKLDGTYFVSDDGKYIFLSDALRDWATQQVTAP